MCTWLQAEIDEKCCCFTKEHRTNPGRTNHTLIQSKINKCEAISTTSWCPNSPISFPSCLIRMACDRLDRVEERLSIATLSVVGTITSNIAYLLQRQDTKETPGYFVQLGSTFLHTKEMLKIKKNSCHSLWLIGGNDMKKPTYLDFVRLCCEPDYRQFAQRLGSHNLIKKFQFHKHASST